MCSLLGNFLHGIGLKCILPRSISRGFVAFVCMSMLHFKSTPSHQAFAFQRFTCLQGFATLSF